jgi:PAS domain S-box-containing protein
MTRLEGIGLDQALERAGDGVFVIDAEGRLVSWNRAAERILGYSAREVIGRPCCEILAGHDEHDNLLCYPGCHVRSLTAMGEAIQNFDMRVRTKAGPAVWVNVSVLVVKGASGQGRHGLTVHIFHDVTATKELLTLVHERLATAGHQDAAPVETLTRREVEVLRLLATGVKTKEIADRLHVSEATVRNHVQHILIKLGAHTRLEAVALAMRHRLL